MDNIQKKNKLLGHFLVIFTMIVWGTTFISTKVLLEAFTPMQIAFIRFIIAFAIVYAIHPKSELKSKTLKERIREEIPFAFLGIWGVTLYFWTENTALKYTNASNVSLIVSAAPLLTSVFLRVKVKDQKIGRNIILGFCSAFFGIFLVVFNGRILHLNPIGDFLSFLAAVSWAVYSILIRNIGAKYSALFLNRKVFFYGIITTIPFIIVEGDFNISAIFIPINLLNLLFLGIIASAMCYILWNTAVGIIGVVTTNNYIYLIPLVTVACSFLILHEKITLLMTVGIIFIILGVYTSQKK